jgi:hypothetical protein
MFQLHLRRFFINRALSENKFTRGIQITILSLAKM